MDNIKRLLDTHRLLVRALAAFGILALVVGLVALGLARKVDPSPPKLPRDYGDVALYNSIVGHVQSGESYYRSTIHEHRHRGYPLRPFVTVRLPTLAWTMAMLPGETMRRASLALLALITLVAWAWRLGRAQPNVICYALALAGLTVGVAPAFVEGASSLHEVWAGLLIALSMALRKPDAYVAAVGVGLMAALFRELAAPYLLVMATTALWERRYKEAGAWSAAIIVFAVAVAAHAMKVAELAMPEDHPVSEGWLQFGGWYFVLQTIPWNQFLPNLSWLGATLLPLALLGLISTPLDHRLVFTVVGYTIGFLFLGRDNNWYWGFIIAPLWPLGLATVGPVLVRRVTDIRLLFQNRTRLNVQLRRRQAESAV